MLTTDDLRRRRPSAKPRPPKLDDRKQWVVRRRVPILDVHDHPTKGKVDESLLNLLAENSNARVDKGSPGLAMLGHTTDDGPETGQPPPVGYVRDYVVGEFDGRACLLADFYFDRRKFADAMTYPHRSVERVESKRPEDNYIDAIALLRRAPERPLSLLTHSRDNPDVRVVRYARNLPAMSKDSKQRYAKADPLYRCEPGREDEVRAAGIRPEKSESVGRVGGTLAQKAGDKVVGAAKAARQFIKTKTGYSEGEGSMPPDLGGIDFKSLIKEALVEVLPDVLRSFMDSGDEESSEVTNIDGEGEGDHEAESLEDLATDEPADMDMDGDGDIDDADAIEEDMADTDGDGDADEPKKKYAEAMPGASNGYIPGMAGKKAKGCEVTTKKMSETGDRTRVRYEQHIAEQDATIVAKDKEIANLKVRYARENKRRGQLDELAKEGYELDVAEELEDTISLPDVKFDKHLEKIRSRYAMNPIDRPKVQVDRSRAVGDDDDITAEESKEVVRYARKKEDEGVDRDAALREGFAWIKSKRIGAG